MARMPNTSSSTPRCSARGRSKLVRRMTGMVGTLCAVLLATAPGVALAQFEPAPADASSPPAATADAEALSEQAVEAFSEKRYGEGIVLFEQAYALDANPNYLFNIGRVYEEKGDLEQAVAHYQEFVSQPGVDLESREAATQRLKVLRGALQQLQEENEEDNEDGDPDQETALEAEPAPSDSEDDQGPSDRKRGQRIAGYALLGVGGGGLIVGGVLGGLAQSKASDADSAEFVDDTLRMRDDARRQARAADAMFIAGGVLAAAGLVLVLTTLGKKKASASAAVASRRWVIAPAASPRSAGAALHGRF